MVSTSTTYTGQSRDPGTYANGFLGNANASNQAQPYYKLQNTAQPTISFTNYVYPSWMTGNNPCPNNYQGYRTMKCYTSDLPNRSLTSLCPQDYSPPR